MRFIWNRQEHRSGDCETCKNILELCQHYQGTPNGTTRSSLCSTLTVFSAWDALAAAEVIWKYDRRIMINWLIDWLGFTTLQHFKGYIAPVSVVNVRMSVRAGLVGSYHLAPSNIGWILLPHPTGGVCRVRRGQTILHSRSLVIYPNICVDSANGFFQQIHYSFEGEFKEVKSHIWE